MTTQHTAPLLPRRARRGRRAAGPAAILLAATTAASVVFPAQAAHAATGTLSCTGTSHLTFSPGLTYTPQTVTLTETDSYTSCVSSDPTINSGYISGSFSVRGASCADVSAGPDGYRVNWNNGQTSRIAFNEAEVTVVDGVQQYTGTGTVT
ncbi:hypothetical protein, partial [Amycolatopsis sp. NPDC059021]|uniref:hypothetical protein n=1 Tax=Amycolatopsis sp. NPDC059021 TaxID=3346704 RepID=UPI00366E9E9E